jgi:hypothetical protein
MRTAKNKNEKGYTLLEYCAGAAIVVSVLYGALNTLGGDLKLFLGKIGTWAKNVEVGQPK